MKTPIMLLFGAGLLLVLAQVEGWAQEKYQPKADEELYGTWINDTVSGKLITFAG